MTIHTDHRDAIYTDWAGEQVTVTRETNGEITIGETEYGGTYTVTEAIKNLKHIQAPAEIIEWTQK